MTTHTDPKDMRVVHPNTGEIHPAEDFTLKELFVYVCPTPGCPSYYGSNNMVPLEDSWHGPKVEDQGERELKGQSRYTSNRAECPECRDAGRGRVMRIRLRTTINVPKQGPPAPEPPKGHVVPPVTGTRILDQV